VYFKNILLYGAETWSRSKREESKLQAVEMKFLRRIARKTRSGRIRSTCIRGQHKMEEIQNQIEKVDLDGLDMLNKQTN
jgi:hypothetical protein